MACLCHVSVCHGLRLAFDACVLQVDIPIVQGVSVFPLNNHLCRVLVEIPS